MCSQQHAQVGSRWSNSKLMRTFICRCKESIIGREWPGTTPAESSRNSDILPDASFQPNSPLLMMVAPSLRVHPATDTLLRYISPEIEWVLLGIDERWREKLRVVFTKRPETIQLRTAV